MDGSTLGPWSGGEILGHYRVGPVIGRGGTGVVHEAFDLHRKRTVALKRLREGAPMSSLKREFRRASALRHPNLVRMHEMLEVDGHRFFTMERVHGRSIVSASVVETVDDPTAAEPATGSIGWRDADPAAVRRSFAQLARALDTVHDAGLLHLDLQPENVLVETTGRVVLLDFGLSRALHLEARAPRGGTPGFAAPELMAPEAPTAAADWYGFGALLLVALRSRPSSTRDASADTELEALAMALVDPDPARRPDARTVLACLDTSHSIVTSHRRACPLVGRESEIRALTRALHRAGRGEARLVRIVGPAGIGKTRLVDALVETARDAWIVRGVCRPNEDAPFNGLDEIVDAIALDHTRVTPVLDARARSALARMFPALSSRLGPEDGSDDPHEARRQGARALVATVRAAASGSGLVLVLEDGHLAGADTAGMLAELWEDAIPGLLLVLTLRPRDERTGWKVLGRLATGQGRTVDDLVLGPLSDDDVRSLSRQTVDIEHAAVEAAVAGAGGTPLLALEIAGAPEVDGSLDETVRARLASLAPPARRLALLCALAGRCRRKSALAVAGLSEPSDDVLAELERLRLATARGVGSEERLEPVHAQIAAVVASSVSEHERVATLRALARELEREFPDDSLAISTCLHRAGDADDALPHALRAAETAERMLAFDSAVASRRLALTAPSLTPQRRAAIELQIAEALVAAGRAQEAARAFGELANSARDPSARFGFAQRAMEHALLSGDLADGVQRLRALASESGLAWPATPAAATVRAVGLLVSLRARGLLARPRVDCTDARRRADVAFAAARGLLAVDSIRGAYFALASLWESLASGDEERLARGLLVVGAGVLGAVEGPLGKWGDSMIATARAIADRRGERRLLGFAAVAECQSAIYRGEWSDALEHGERGLEHLRGCAGVSGDIVMAYMGIVRAIEELGDLEQARARVRELLRDAEARGDRYADITASLYAAMHDLHAGDLEGAQRRAADAMEHWPATAYTVQHFYAARVRVLVLLSRGALNEAAHSFADTLRRLRAAGLGRVPVVAMDAEILAGRVALSQLARGHSGVASRRARSAARALRRFRRPDAIGHALAIEGSLAAFEGRHARAIHALGAAEAVFEARGMRLARASVRARRREIAGDDSSSDLDFIANQGIPDPSTWLDLELPCPRTGRAATVT